MNICRLARKLRELPSAAVEVDGGDVIDAPAIYFIRLDRDCRFDHGMQLPNYSRNIGGVAILLETLVDDIDPTDLCSMVIHPFYRQTCFKFIEYLSRHNLESLAGFIVFIDRVLCPRNETSIG